MKKKSYECSECRMFVDNTYVMTRYKGKHVYLCKGCLAKVLRFWGCAG